MELSQHLFDLQMARYMRCAGESPPSGVPQTMARPESSVRTVDQPVITSNEAIITTNNAGTGENAHTTQAPQSASGIDVREVMERSNQLAERLAALLERSNELAGQSTQSTEQSGPMAERFNQVLERLTQLVEKVHQPADIPGPLAERFTHFMENFDRMVEQSDRSPMPQSNRLELRLTQLLEGFNQHLKQSNELSKEANVSAKQLNELTERSNQLTEQISEPVEKLEGVMKNINKVLVGIQHAIIRSYKGNTTYALNCLVNEKGETPGSSLGTRAAPFQWKSNSVPGKFEHGVVIGGVPQSLPVPDHWLPEFLCFHGIWEGLCETDTSHGLKENKIIEARKRLSRYMSSCLG
ncbi:hypothetical protein B0J17DRAFT_667550 [Rhizoctonia solani]|nr:hypothetical protein B0J17DRAFT_667550 [Rhizoctonia solani]